MKSKADLEAYAIMYVIKYKKGDVISLLLKNGVVVPSDSNDMQVALVVTEMLKKSKSFKDEFAKLVQSKEVVSGLTSNMSGMYSNMSGYNNAQGFTYQPIVFDDSIWGSATTKPSSTTTNTSLTKDGAEKTISGFEKYLLLGQGLFSDYTKMKENEAKVKLANASVELAKAESQSGGSKKSSATSTTLYVVLGLVGLGMLGYLTYKLSKK